MGAWLRDFWNDKAAFAAMMVRGTNKLKLLLGVLAGGIFTGVPPFTELTAYLGKAGWWGSGILILVAIAVKSGDKTPPKLAALSEEKLDRLIRLLDAPERPPAN
jgi:hypothetical protein